MSFTGGDVPSSTIRNPKRDFLSLYDLTAAEVHALIARAIELKELRANGHHPRTLQHKVLGMIFEKVSTRTRVSFEVGMFELGGHAVHLATADSHVSRSEPLEDTARALSGYCSAILMRTFGQERLQTLAEFASVPVINGLTDRQHPCQVMADLQTVEEHLGDLRSLRFAWVGDGNNMAHSWLHAAGLLGLDLSLACPPGYGPQSEVVEEAKRRQMQAGAGSITLSNDPKEVVEDREVLCTDVWVSMGQEKEVLARLEAFRPFCVSQELVACAAKDCIVLHCLPAHRGQEIAVEVLEGPNSVVWQQAENRLHAQKAILELIVGASAKS